MAVVKGQNLRIFVGERPIAAALQCSLNLRMNVQQYSSKDDEGDFSQLMVASVEWSVRSNAVITQESLTDDDAVAITDLMDLRGQTVRVQLNTAAGVQNRESQGTLLAGEAIVSDVQITAQNRQRTVYDVTLTGVKNALIDIRAILTADTHYIITADGHRVCAAHEE